MPYLITTRHQRDIGHKAGIPWPLDRRAVATLDEAREAARDALPGSANLSRYYECEDIPEEGGTVGPLPDGTIIEVRHAPGRDGWRELAAATKRVYAAGGEREILDAYNAVSEGSR